MARDVKVKVCGITNLKDALASIDSGCDALGFVFYRKSPRYITPAKVRRMVRYLPKRVIKMGVFVNAPESRVKKIAKTCALDILQFHGEEKPDYCGKFKGYKIIKAFRIKDSSSLKDLLRYKPFAYLFDTYAGSKVGGTGRRFDWKLIRHIDGLKKPIFLSGGLDEENVEKAIRQVKPDWVDVSSSVEVSPGIKDHSKVRRFVEAVKQRGKVR